MLACWPAAASDEVERPPPNWQRYKLLGETAIRKALAGGPNWAIEWPNGYLRRRWHRKGQPYGYVTCGKLHATGPVIGRYPRTYFLIVVVGDAVETLNIGTPSRATTSPVAADIWCSTITSPRPPPWRCRPPPG